MADKVIALGGWKGAQIPVTFATAEEATILREAVTTYLRLYASADDDAQKICEQFVSAIDEQLRANPPAQPPEPSLNPPNSLAPKTGGISFKFSVNADGSTTQWVATADVPWLSVNDPLAPTSGDGTVTYGVMANANAPRNGTITVSGFNLTFSVNQMAGDQAAPATDPTAGAQTQGIL
jgi:hypothetical protein